MIMIVLQMGRPDDFEELYLDWLHEIDKSSMVTHNSSLKVVEEKFSISSPYEIWDLSYKFNKVERWFSYWTVIPGGRLLY